MFVHTATERRFPIQGGPSVPWRVMVPHEAQARRNHDQDLETLARRGGLSAGEAWLAVGGLPMDMYTNAQWDGFAARWRDFADKVNGTFASSATASASPDGWKLVPVDPTGDMLLAGGKRLERQSDSTHYEGTGRAADAWSAMLEAAPLSPNDIQGQGKP